MQLEESLLLFSQIADLQLPTLLAINFRDELESNEVQIDIDGLQSQFGCKVILTSAQIKDDIDALKAHIENNEFQVPNAICRSLYDIFLEDGSYTNNYRELAQQKIDLDFMNWLGEKELPFSIIFTKADKLKPNAITQNIKLYQSKMLEYWEEMPQYFITSSSKSIGKEELLNFIEQTNTQIEALRKKS